MTDDYTLRPAHYAKKMMAVTTKPDGSGFKTRADRLAEALARGRYTHRERAWIMSQNKAEMFERLYAEGWDASPFSYKLEAPKQ